jgi:transposase
MPKPYLLDLPERIVRFVDEGHSHRAAAAYFRVSVSFVVNVVNAFVHGTPCRQGRTPPR